LSSSPSFLGFKKLASITARSYRNSANGNYHIHLHPLSELMKAVGMLWEVSEHVWLLVLFKPLLIFFSVFLFFRVGFPTCLLICGQSWNCLELSYWVIFQFYSHECHL
jgi:hypothetical protein